MSAENPHGFRILTDAEVEKFVETYAPHKPNGAAANGDGRSQTPIKHAVPYRSPPAADKATQQQQTNGRDMENDALAQVIVKIVNGKYPAAADAIETAALAHKLPIYHRGPKLCRPVHETSKRHDGKMITSAVLQDYDPHSLRRAIDPAASFIKLDGKARKDVSCEPPEAVIRMVMGGTATRVFPMIRGIVQTPILRRDLSLFSIPGFDPETGRYLVDPPNLTIPAKPTEGDAVAALERLKDLLSEFPFEDEVSRAVALSGLITPLVRTACDVVPGHFFNAPRMGSGKSLLVDLAAAIATGERAWVILAHKNPEEQDKQITAALMAGRLLIVLDNLVKDLDSTIVAHMLERQKISVRPMKTSDTVDIVNSFCGYMTGINVDPSGDNTRRTLVSRLVPDEESPFDRVYEKQNPFYRVIAKRSLYASACLTIVLAYHAAKCPCPQTPTPSYDEWDRLVREPLIWLGLPDPVTSMRTAEEQDERTGYLAALIEAWPCGKDAEWTASELIVTAERVDDKGNAIYPDLAEALQPIARNRRGAFDPGVLGRFLRGNRDKLHGKLRIRKVGRRHNNLTLWKLV